MRLDINYKKKKKTVRNTNTWRLNNTFPNNQQGTEEIKRETKKFLETNDNENTTQNLGCSESSSKREVYSNTILPRETRQNRRDNLTLHLKDWKKKKNNNKN